MRLIVLALSATLASGCVVVVAGTCNDGIQNEGETDVDCGGPHCAPCPDGAHCVVAADCAGNSCLGGICGIPVPTASCSDGIKNGNESDVDCGGSCTPCAGGKVCVANSDCQSQVCTGHVCTPHPTGSGQTPSAGDVVSIALGQGATVPASGGYAITANTGSYRLIALGSAGHELQGSIYSAGGISQLNVGCGGQCSLAATDYVSQPYNAQGGQRIDFDFIAATQAEGFDFAIGTNTLAIPVYFDLLLDGQPAVTETVFTSGDTGQPRNPSSMPFGVYGK